MSTTKVAGLQPSRVRGAAPNSNGLNEYPIASGATAMYTGTPVRIASGTLTPCVTTTEVPVGTFQGCRYVEDGEQKFKPYYSGVSASDIVGLVNDNPGQTYIISSNATVVAGIVGNNVEVSAIAGGSTFTGKSTIVAKTTAGTSGKATNGLLRVIGIVDEPSNAAGDAFTKMEVAFNYDATDYQNVVTSAVVTTTN
jgi:hypothetical protein